MMVETGAIRSNLVGGKDSMNTAGVDLLNDILVKCKAVYDSNNAVKDSIQAYRYTISIHSLTLFTDSIVVLSLNLRR